MRLAICSWKGGVAKTTTAVHLAAVLQHQARTLLIDGDANHGAIGWAARGPLPFDVVPLERAPRELASTGYGHVVIDTEARPVDRDLARYVAVADVFVIPTTPDVLALQALEATVAQLRALQATNYRVLLTIVPPPPAHDDADARMFLRSRDVPVFRAVIPRTAAFQHAALAGRTVGDLPGPRAARAWAAYRAVGKELQRR